MDADVRLPDPDASMHKPGIGEERARLSRRETVEEVLIPRWKGPEKGREERCAALSWSIKDMNVYANAHGSLVKRPEY